MVLFNTVYLFRVCLALFLQRCDDVKSFESFSRTLIELVKNIDLLEAYDQFGVLTLLYDCKLCATLFK